MDSSALIYALRWIVRDTFRQAVAGKVFWLLLILSAVATIFCLGISIEGGVRIEDGYPVDREGRDLVGPNPNPGTLNLLFGAVKVAIARGAVEEVHLIQVMLATWVAGSAGLLLTLIWTAGFLPDSLQPASASVLLAKPIPHWAYLLGKYLGVVLFVALQSAIFFFSTWVALGIKTQVWTAGYLAGTPLLILQFAGLYAFSVLLATITRSTIACVLGIILFWVVCLAVNSGRHAAVALPHMETGARLSPSTLFISNLGYWLLPKPVDMLLSLEDALDADRLKSTLSGVPEFEIVRKIGAFDPLLSAASTIIFIAIAIALSSWQLSRTDY